MLVGNIDSNVPPPPRRRSEKKKYTVYRYYYLLYSIPCRKSGCVHAAME